MTFCIGIKVAEGLVGLADSRITTGTERTTARKVSVIERPNHSMFVMTSGLRSVRDKALTYYEEALDEGAATFDKLYKCVNALAEQVRRVAKEDKEALQDSGLSFDLCSLVGGQLERDDEHKLFLLYPQGNWVEVSRGTPYFIIGESGYGKPLCDRALHYETSMVDALKIAYLAFDATKTSATDVDFPLDVVLSRAESHHIIERRFEREELGDTSAWWQEQVRRAVDELPSDWTDLVFSMLDRGEVRYLGGERRS